MKSVRIVALAAFACFFLGLGALLFYDHWVNTHRIVPGPENMSAFLQTYDPENILRNFRDPHESYSGGRGQGASMDVAFIEHTAEFTPCFTIDSTRKTALMAALQEDIAQHLQRTGTRVTARRVEAGGGFRFDYVAGRSNGSIRVAPPGPALVHRNTALSAGLEDISVTIALQETWTPPKHRN